jgi:hypothetical protein
MSQHLDTFVEWFNQLLPSEKDEIVSYISGISTTARFDGYYAGPAPERRGYYAGPAPGQQSHSCPTCGKPL